MLATFQSHGITPAASEAVNIKRIAVQQYRVRSGPISGSGDLFTFKLLNLSKPVI